MEYFQISPASQTSINMSGEHCMNFAHSPET